MLPPDGTGTVTTRGGAGDFCPGLIGFGACTCMVRGTGVDAGCDAGGAVVVDVGDDATVGVLDGVAVGVGVGVTVLMGVETSAGLTATTFLVAALTAIAVPPAMTHPRSTAPVTILVASILSMRSL